MIKNVWQTAIIVIEYSFNYLTKQTRLIFFH